MKKGDRVIYNGEEFEVYFAYDSGYCEIRRLSRRNITLVHESEIQKNQKAKIGQSIET